MHKLKARATMMSREQAQRQASHVGAIDRQDIHAVRLSTGNVVVSRRRWKTEVMRVNVGVDIWRLTETRHGAFTLSRRRTNTPFTRWSWLYESARRALDERSTSWLDEQAIWSFEWCNIANIHEAARRALAV